MINRRELNTGLGLLAMAGMSSGARASKAEPFEYAPMPKVPWTRTGAIRRGGGPLHYATLGPENSGKPPIVMLHRLGGWMADWRHVAPVIAEGRQVILFDLPGHGGSQWPGPPPYIQTLGETAGLLVGALDEMAIPQIDLIGTSLGGCAAVSVAAFYPERVRRLAIVSSALGPAKTLAEIADKIDAGQKQNYDAAGLPVPFEPELLVKTFGIVNTRDIWLEGNSSRRAAGRWNQPSERGVGITDILGNLKRVEAPTLLLYGALDKAYLKFRPAAEANLRHSRTAFVPNSGAFVMQDNPGPTGAILKEFVEKG